MADETRRPEVSEMADMMDGERGLTTGAIVAGAMAAILVAVMLRRARQREEEQRMHAMMSRPWERVAHMLGDERVEASREFLTERLLPEFKPALLAILKDLEKQTDNWFRQAEKGIKRM